MNTVNRLFLILDDKDYMRDLNQQILQRAGVSADHIKTFANATEASRALPELLAQPENKDRELVIITDYNMPGGSADKLYAFLDKLIAEDGKLSSRLKILGLTGNKDPDVHSNAMRTYPSLNNVPKAFLAKPYSMYGFVDTLIDSLNVPIQRLIKPS